MKRWHVLCPDALRTKPLYDDLIAAGIEKGQIHLFAKDRIALKTARLPEPSDMEETMVAGEGMGRFISGMMGAAPPDPKIADFRRDIAEGKVLMVVVLPTSQRDEVAAIIARHQDAWSPEATPDRKRA